MVIASKWLCRRFGLVADETNASFLMEKGIR
ncbi:hypothetical protein Thal_0134 [Thermocrinis albus DSM 14484]|uniref:Uncharacterized protein n=1 Tax=Thermocrinis albus (strain DSM 14484 / JCM 11386 / HI 11/12) TaxID=638303 RepID=D3SNN3_THEAH|nr:hypothetical protein Thal_0134 [Thermocrinis albus DSM 14484]